MNKLFPLVLLLASTTALSAPKQEIKNSNCANNFQGVDRSPINIYCQFTPSTSVQDSYLIATHPTTLRLEAVNFFTYIYDGNREFLAATLKNESELPALYTKISLALEIPGKAISKSKIIKTEKSGFYTAAGDNGIKITPNQSIALPLVSIRDINKLIIPEQSHPGYCLYDVSVKPPEELWSEYVRSHATNQNNIIVRDTRTFMLRVKVEYKTIFKETNTNYVSFFLSYANENKPGMAWYASKNQIDNLTCLNTGRYP